MSDVLVNVLQRKAGNYGRVVGPLPNSLNGLLINGDDPNYLPTGMILQLGGGNSNIFGISTPIPGIS